MISDARATNAPAGNVERRAIRGFARQRLGLLATVTASWMPLLLASLVGSATLIVLARHPIGQNSDGLLQTIMSIQKLTVFFWGQDRFANLLPALTTGIADPHANALCQLALRTVSGLIAPLFFCVLATPRDDPGTAWRATLAAFALLLAFAPQRMIYEALIEASPYGTSLALAGTALLVFRRAGRAGDHGSGWVVLRATGLLLTCAAYLVNASLVLVAAPLVAGEMLLFGSALAVEFALASVFAAGLTAVVALASSTSVPTSFGFGETTVGLAYFGQQLLTKPGFFFGGMTLASAASLLSSCYLRRDPRIADHLGHAAILVATFAISLVTLALSTWVVMNHMHPRYLVPLYFLMASLGGLSLLQLVQGAVRWPMTRDVAVLGACACLLLVAARRTPPPSDARGGIIGVASRPMADAVAAVVLERALDGIAGNYWDTWPAVFQAEQLAHELGRPAGRVFGITYRGEVRRTALIARLLEKGRLDIACIDHDPISCNTLFAQTMLPPSTVPRSAGTPMTLPGGRTLTFLTVERAAFRSP